MPEANNSSNLTEKVTTLFALEQASERSKSYTAEQLSSVLAQILSIFQDVNESLTNLENEKISKDDLGDGLGIDENGKVYIIGGMGLGLTEDDLYDIQYGNYDGTGNDDTGDSRLTAADIDYILSGSDVGDDNSRDSGMTAAEIDSILA